MTNIITTIPKGKYGGWAEVEYLLKSSDGETGGFWLINTNNLPKKDVVGSLCYMVFDGQIRGYFSIVDTALSENYRKKHRLGKARTTHCIVMANWHLVHDLPEMTGFQGWRYTELRP